jgi:hypothetical protein
MASRAHVHDYYEYAPPERPRRAVYYPGHDDPVVLPRDRSASAVLIVSGLVATAVIAGGAYALFAGVPPPPMRETETPALVPTYQLDDQPLKAKRFEVLGGPARAVPAVVGGSQPAEAAEDAAETETVDTPAAPGARTPPPEVRLEPEPVPRPRPMPAPAQAPALPPEPETRKELPYPDPTTTPPDAIAPPGSSPESPQPLLDADNPYR